MKTQRVFKGVGNKYDESEDWLPVFRIILRACVCVHKGGFYSSNLFIF